MTQEETMKVWTDMSARVMYHPKIRVTNTYLNQTYDDVLTMANFTQYADVKYEVKPYLREMSSMSKEEYVELRKMTTTSPNLETSVTLFKEHYYEETPNWRNDWTYCALPNVLKWLNEHDFDYSGLIPMGLAFDQKEEIRKTV